MTDDQTAKPREWWIRPEASYCADFIFKEDPTTYWAMTKGECIHVIEKSAYDAVVKAHDEMVSISKAMQDLCKEIEPEVRALKAEVERLKAEIIILAQKLPLEPWETVIVSKQWLMDYYHSAGWQAQAEKLAEALGIIAEDKPSLTYHMKHSDISPGHHAQESLAAFTKFKEGMK